MVPPQFCGLASGALAESEGELNCLASVSPSWLFLAKKPFPTLLIGVFAKVVRKPTCLNGKLQENRDGAFTP